MSLTVRMLQTRCGSEDGFMLRYYFCGEIYLLPDLLAWRFLQKGWACLSPDSSPDHP